MRARRSALATLAALLALTAAQPAVAERDFRIGTTAFSMAEVLDARSLATLGGEPAILVTLNDTARAKLEAASRAALGQAITALLDGQLLSGPVVQEPISDGTIELTGIKDFTEGEALALKISGKPPAPDSLEE